MSKETGGPAFPELGSIAYNSDWSSEAGMTLRDYMAAKAMQGAIANDIFADSGSDHEIEWVVKLSYKYADAMLEAREE